MKNQDLISLIVVIAVVVFGAYLWWAAQPKKKAIAEVALDAVQRVSRGLKNGGIVLLLIGLLLCIFGGWFESTFFLILGGSLFSPGFIAVVFASQLK